MKLQLFPYALLFCLFSCIFICSCSSENKKTEYGSNIEIVYQGKTIKNIDFQTAYENYKNYCAGCHGDNMEAFVSRDWVYGKLPDSVFNTIKFGKDDIGMPGFSEGISDKQINDLVYFLLVEGNDPEFAASARTNSGEIHTTEKQKFEVVTVLDGLNIPWGMEFLPNNEMLISERSGTLLHLYADGTLNKVKNVPKVYDFGQGGLLDLELHPEYTKNGWIYISYSYSKFINGKETGSTALMRARLKNDVLVDQEILFKAAFPEKRGVHFGSKIEFDNDGYLYFSVGDRGKKEMAQSVTRPNGKIHRIHDDGSIPLDNPFIDNPKAVKSIYTYGHRNPQGVAMHPETGVIWTSEHGPKGGDELNIIQAGKNYGWPLITFGINYNGTIITKDTAKAGMLQPVTYWVPSIAPCGMTFVNSDRYKNWKNNILIGSLRFKYLVRVELDGDKAVHQEILLNGIGRVRNVEISKDGYIFVATEKPGRILKLIPIE